MDSGKQTPPSPLAAFAARLSRCSRASTTAATAGKSCVAPALKTASSCARRGRRSRSACAATATTRTFTWAHVAQQSRRSALRRTAHLSALRRAPHPKPAGLLLFRRPTPAACAPCARAGSLSSTAGATFCAVYSSSDAEATGKPLGASEDDLTYDNDSGPGAGSTASSTATLCWAI